MATKKERTRTTRSGREEKNYYEVLVRPLNEFVLFRNRETEFAEYGDRPAIQRARFEGAEDARWFLEDYSPNVLTARELLLDLGTVPQNVVEYIEQVKARKHGPISAVPAVKPERGRKKR